MTVEPLAIYQEFAAERQEQHHYALKLRQQRGWQVAQQAAQLQFESASPAIHHAILMTGLELDESSCLNSPTSIIGKLSMAYYAPLNWANSTRAC